MKWYVMNVFNGKEKKVKEDIETALAERKIGEYVANIVVPKERYFQVRNGKKVKLERNYYPGYMMIECDLNGEVLRTIQHVKGVISFLGDKTPSPMSDMEVRNMLKKVDEIETSDEVAFESGLILGQDVQIVDGPFASFNGTITEILDDKQKVKVDVLIFSRKTPLELNFEQVVPN